MTKRLYLQYSIEARLKLSKSGLMQKLSLLSLLVFLVPGCGIYTFGGNVPGHLKSVAIPIFENQTSEFEIVELLTEAVEEAFRVDNTLKIKDIKNADSVLNGTIIRIGDVPSTYNADETVDEYKITVSVQVSFEDKIKGKIIWEEIVSGWGIYPSDGVRDEGMEKAVEKLAEDILNKTVSGW
ncbi:MAG: LptE family protein [Candidatus Electryonea clarkiae]|nr:LptE family protein [Candidatus Electryonea clarkiae]MDP8286845.1 LptE family protein [Candidatus Electryonea clarkiae]